MKGYADKEKEARVRTVKTLLNGMNETSFGVKKNVARFYDKLMPALGIMCKKGDLEALVASYEYKSCVIGEYLLFKCTEGFLNSGNIKPNPNTETLKLLISQSEEAQNVIRLIYESAITKLLFNIQDPSNVVDRNLYAVLTWMAKSYPYEKNMGADLAGKLFIFAEWWDNPVNSQGLNGDKLAVFNHELRTEDFAVDYEKYKKIKYKDEFLQLPTTKRKSSVLVAPSLSNVCDPLTPEEQKLLPQLLLQIGMSPHRKGDSIPREDQTFFSLYTDKGINILKKYSQTPAGQEWLKKEGGKSFLDLCKDMKEKGGSSMSIGGAPTSIY